MRWGLFTRTGKTGRGRFVRSTVYTLDMPLRTALEIALCYGPTYQPVLLTGRRRRHAAAPGGPRP